MSRALASGTWCERQESSVFLPSMDLGPVQPLGVRNTIMGQNGRSSLPAAASALIRAMWLSTSSSRVANRRCTS
ncbi:hypothetical protein D3C74_309510 [compost metagenome]